MTKRIEGMQDAELEQQRRLPYDWEEYVNRHPNWPSVVSMRQVVADQLIEIVEVDEDA